MLACLAKEDCVRCGCPYQICFLYLSLNQRGQQSYFCHFQRGYGGANIAVMIIKYPPIKIARFNQHFLIRYTSFRRPKGGRNGSYIPLRMLLNHCCLSVLLLMVPVDWGEVRSPGVFDEIYYSTLSFRWVLEIGVSNNFCFEFVLMSCLDGNEDVGFRCNENFEGSSQFL